MISLFTEETKRRIIAHFQKPRRKMFVSLQKIEILQKKIDISAKRRYNKITLCGDADYCRVQGVNKRTRGYYPQNNKRSQIL